MVDSLSLLEERVEGIIKQLETALNEKEELLQKLDESLLEIEELQEQNLNLQAQVENLDRTVQDSSGKESQIRERLKGMLEKIDSLELEFNAQQTAE